MNEKMLQQLETEVKHRGLSVKTLKKYVKRTEFFLRWVDKPAQLLNEHYTNKSPTKNNAAVSPISLQGKNWQRFLTLATLCVTKHC
jgi:hypothetical protein